MMFSLRFACVLMLFCPCQLPAQSTGSRLMTHEIPFSGTASGGSLALVESFNRRARFITIDTLPGESAEAVASRLASVISQNDPFKWGGDGGAITISGTNGHLGPLPGPRGAAHYLLAGTEHGLGIPLPPLSVSATYDIDSDSINLRWNNPPGAYDAIRIGDTEFHFGKRLPGSATSCVLSGRREAIEGIDIHVVGFKNDIPSNMGVVTVNRNSQEELAGAPFTNGVMPNWKSWATGPGLVAEQSPVRRKDVRMIRGANHKPFSQVLRTTTNDTVGGVWRKFLGLKPGNTYRLSARMNSGQANDASQLGSFSLHALAIPAEQNLSPDQMAGTSPLPDGQNGVAAARVAGYGNGITTRGSFEICSTNGACPSRQIDDITLTAAQDAIIVWFRCQRAASGAEFDWIKLECVTQSSR